ncbi:hypothetical protein ACPC54_38525 [Kitasatospora sp. NPDC094028]
MTEADTDRSSIPQDAVPEDAVPQDAVPEAAVPRGAVPKATADRRFEGLRKWWRNGSAESSAPVSAVTGVLTGCYLSTIACALLTGRPDAAAGFFLGMFFLIVPFACLWWALERPRVGLPAMSVSLLLTTAVAMILR